MKRRDCSSRSFLALMWAQGCGALNDNVFRVVITLLIVQTVPPEQRSAYLALVAGLFVLPYIVFSSYAGFLADRLPKSTIIKAAKALEVLITGAAYYFFLRHHLPVLIALFFFMGLHSALFSPSKYGVMPELLDDENLSKGNGYLEFGTFLAIIVGTALGGFLKAKGGDDLTLPGAVIFGIAVFGFIASLLVEPTPVANLTKRFEVNPFKDTALTLRDIAKERYLLQTLLAIAFFWFLGQFFQVNTMRYAPELMGASEEKSALLLSLMAIGTGIGAVGAGKVSEGKVELGLVPIGALGLSIFCMLLSGSYDSYTVTAILFVLLGVSSGFYIVPLNAYMQHESPAESRGRYLAAMNVVTFLGMLVSSVVFWLVTGALSLSPAAAFFFLGAMTLVVGAVIVRTIPSMLIRCVNWLISRFFYSLRVYGKENVPKRGGALIVCNHVSFIDPPLLLSAIERPIRFLMYKPIYDLKPIKPIARALHAIPIAPEMGPKKVMASLIEAREAILNGEVVCIFAEGSITRLGRLLPFGKGFERIMKGVDAPIIPAYLDELWGSIFSFKEGKFFWKVPREIPYPATLRFGTPLPADSDSFTVRQALQELSADMFPLRRRRHKFLQAAFLAQAKRTPYRPCIADTSGMRLRYFEVLAGALALARRIKQRTSPKEMVGLWFPASAAGVLANLATLIAGRVPVNLNFTAGNEAIDSSVKQCGITKVISAGAFLAKVPFPGSAEIIRLENLVVSKRAKYLWAAVALAVPRKILERMVIGKDASPDDVATVIFSSGSTGEPKGVMLSHSNVASNVESLYELMQWGAEDSIAGVLPFFHSFGFTGTLWLPLFGGMKSVYHPNPLDAATVGRIVRENGLSMLVSTPTFMTAYIRKIEAADFATLRHMIVGAEKLKDQVAEAFVEKFGVKPLEGYGATELSPVAIANIPDYEDRHMKQTGRKQGTVGQPIPGVAVRVIDPDTGAVLRPGSPGLLLVRGPNVMKGYLNNGNKTAEVIDDGWYRTGDIAELDEEGFVRITDRLSRFSKIGGEMVPHIKVEEAIQRISGEAEQICVVTAVADERKGERLIVLTTKELDIGKIVAALNEQGLPNLWIPKQDSFYRIDALPFLGSGKLDLRRVKELVNEASAA